jgi:hypothetical protein
LPRHLLLVIFSSYVFDFAIRKKIKICFKSSHMNFKSTDIRRKSTVLIILVSIKNGNCTIITSRLIESKNKTKQKYYESIIMKWQIKEHKIVRILCSWLSVILHLKIWFHLQKKPNNVLNWRLCWVNHIFEKKMLIAISQIKISKQYTSSSQNFINW